MITSKTTFASLRSRLSRCQTILRSDELGNAAPHAPSLIGKRGCSSSGTNNHPSNNAKFVNKSLALKSAGTPDVPSLPFFAHIAPLQTRTPLPHLQLLLLYCKHHFSNLHTIQEYFKSTRSFCQYPFVPAIDRLPT
jgi:hypothetical protein